MANETQSCAAAGIRRFLRTWITLLCAALLAGCGPSAWDKAQQENTVEALERFIQENPGSEFVAAASVQIDELSWAQTVKAGTLDAYQDYLSRYPAAGRYSRTAQDKLEELRWEQASSINTLDSYVDYVRTAADRGRIEHARTAVKALHAASAPKTRPLVELDGIFGNNNMIKYVRSIAVKYRGEIAGVPASVLYAVSAGNDADGQQRYFSYREGDAELALLAPNSVQGTIDLESPEHGKIRLALTDLVENPRKDLIGSYLVARNPKWPRSRTDVLEIASSADGAGRPELDQAALFEVRSDYSLVYVP